MCLGEISPLKRNLLNVSNSLFAGNVMGKSVYLCDGMSSILIPTSILPMA